MAGQTAQPMIVPHQRPTLQVGTLAKNPRWNQIGHQYENTNKERTMCLTSVSNIVFQVTKLEKKYVNHTTFCKGRL